MKIQSLVFVQNCWLVTYFEEEYWQYSVLCFDSSFYIPETQFFTADEAYKAGITEIVESMAEDSRS